MFEIQSSICLGYARLELLKGKVRGESPENIAHVLGSLFFTDLTGFHSNRQANAAQSE